MQTYEDTAVKVVYGVNELSLDLGGKSIRGIWKMLEQVLNLPHLTSRLAEPPATDSRGP